jgi:hypothetical protein
MPILPQRVGETRDRDRSQEDDEEQVGESCH